MTGQIATWDHAWLAGARPPIIHLRLRRLPPSLMPALMMGVRGSMGGGLGVAFGAATGNPGFWIAMGLAVGAIFAALMQAASAGCPLPGAPRRR